MRFPALVLLLVAFSGCPAQYEYAKSAPPVQKTVALVEGDERVRAALGANVSVSLAIARAFDRDFANAKLRGNDRVRLLTSVKGATGEATLDLLATNVNQQGWAGSFSVRTEGRQVLRDGQYVTEGAATLLEGSFAADGTPVVKSAP
ncbi:MAG: hypothetical protein ACOZQL_09755 [Myxococcota bacterium]